MEMNAQTAKAIVSMIVVMVVNVAAMFGMSFDSGLIQTIVSVAIVIIATGYAAYKNHNFTEAAQVAQSYIIALKLGEKEGEESDTDMVIEEEDVPADDVEEE